MATIRGTTGDDNLKGSEERDIIKALAGDDRVMGLGGNDQLIGNADNDRMYGGDGDDLVRGRSGNNALFGGDGDDALFGGNDGNRFFGGDGDDYLAGGRGRDGMTGGSGIDVFFFLTRAIGDDVVKDFENGVDKLEVTGSGFDGSFQKLLDATTQQGSNMVINFDNGESITLLNFSKSDFDAGDLILGP